ncbi:hypothetical protein BKA83DRAFT_4125007 [Pisolithus microcarpus]|nr:hypothetical protein BKA83DRAFT_4125007 [Pisolithus microcarpus]
MLASEKIKTECQNEMGHEALSQDALIAAAQNEICPVRLANAAFSNALKTPGIARSSSKHVDLASVGRRWKEISWMPKPLQQKEVANAAVFTHALHATTLEVETDTYQLFFSFSFFTLLYVIELSRGVVSPCNCGLGYWGIAYVEAGHFATARGGYFVKRPLVPGFFRFRRRTDHEKLGGGPYPYNFEGPWSVHLEKKRSRGGVPETQPRRIPSYKTEAGYDDQFKIAHDSIIGVPWDECKAGKIAYARKCAR